MYSFIFLFFFFCSLSGLPAYYIKTVIDNLAGDEVELCKKLLNGTILVKTKNEEQAAKIYEPTSFNEDLIA